MQIMELTSADKEYDIWRGFRRHLFKVNNCPAWIAEPQKPAPGNPWTWCMEFPDSFTERTGVPELLNKGFYHVHIQVGNTFGCPKALKHFDKFYKVIVNAGLAEKGTLIGISRGGLYAYNWAALNPDKVVCIYGDAPVCDFKSWPAGKGEGVGSQTDWMELIQHYGFEDENEALVWEGNPVDNLGSIAKAEIPIIHVVGDIDKIVPPQENSDVLEKKYNNLGGKILVIHKPDVGHHPHGLEDPAPIVDFILRAHNISLQN